MAKRNEHVSETSTENPAPRPKSVRVHNHRQARSEIPLNSQSPSLKQAFVELTNFCNLRCKMCLGGKRPEGYMNPTLFRKVMDELADLRVGYVALNYGGESLLHPQFKQLLTYAMTKRRTIDSIGWISNGMLFNEETVDMVLDLEVDWLTFSLEGLGKVNDSIRRGARYDVIERNILKLLRKRGSRTKPQVLINITQTTQSRADIDELIDFWIDKADRITENPCYAENLKFAGLKDYLQEREIGTNDHCDSPFSTMGILWNGDAVPCCRDINGNNLMGNLAQNTIKSVWLGGEYKKLRLSCARNKFQANTLCHSCDVWKYYFKKPTRNPKTEMQINIREQEVINLEDLTVTHKHHF